MGLLSALYAFGMERRNRRFDEGRAPVEHCTVPVISVGNLSVGGTGKTPTVHFIVRMLIKHGHRPAIVLRGYGRSTRGVRIVRNGPEIFMSAREAGDEALLHAYAARVPVVVAERRADGARCAVADCHASVVVLDDGFQHRSLHRDLDIVLINEATVQDRRLLPEGRLREPFTSLRRADVVVLTQNGVTDEDVRPYVSNDVLIARSRVQARQPYSLATLADLQRNVMLHERVVAVTSIANPERFITSLRTLAPMTDVVRHMAFSDHHRFTSFDVTAMVQTAAKEGIEMVVTTEKDAVKLMDHVGAFTMAGIDVAVVPLRLTFTQGSDAFEQLIMERTHR